MKKLFKEPLVHFILIGIALFVAYALINGTNQEVEAGDRQIVVGTGKIEQLANIFAKTWQRPPTREELQSLIDDFVLEEIYYRKALEMRLDQDDTVVRRRMRQKVEFLTDDTAALIEPTEKDLNEYLRAHEQDFREPSNYSFQQIYFNPDQHGDDPDVYVQQQLSLLRAGSSDIGDASLLPERFDDTTANQVDATFGLGFSKQLDGLPLKEWAGPLRSGIGLHLIRIEARVEGQIPSLEQIRPTVEREWSNQRRKQIREQVNASMLEEFNVIVEWPEDVNEE